MAIDGFQIVSSDVSGKCVSNSTEYLSQTTVQFGKNILLSCTVSFATFASFSSYCTTGSIDQWSLIGNIVENFKTVGVFGNSNVNNNYDWIPVISANVSLTNGSIDSAR